MFSETTNLIDVLGFNEIQIPAHVLRILNKYYDRWAITQYCNSNGRTITNVTHDTFHKPLLQLIYTLLHLYMNNQTTIRPVAKFINNVTETTDIESIINDIASYPGHEDKTLLRFVHIPRTKTIFDPKLTNEYTTYVNSRLGERLTDYENILTTLPNQYLRIYKKENCLTFISDVFDTQSLTLLSLFSAQIFYKIEENNTEQTQKLVFKVLETIYNVLSKKDAIENINNALKELEDCLKENDTSTKTFLQQLINRQTILLKRDKENQLANIDSSIKSYERRLNEFYTQRQETLLELNGLNITPEVDISELETFLKNNKHIEVLSTIEQTMTLRITAPLTNYDPTIYTQYVTRNAECVQRLSKNMQKVLYETFINNKYKLMLQAVIQIDLNDHESVTAIRTENNADYTTLPNPHLGYYNCWSQALTEIKKHFTNSEYILAFLQMISAVQSVNMLENATFITRMLPDLNKEYWQNKLIFIDEDNNTLNYQQVLTQLNENTETPTTTTPEYTQIILNEEDVEPLEPTAIAGPQITAEIAEPEINIETEATV